MQKENPGDCDVASTGNRGWSTIKSERPSRHGSQTRRPLKRRTATSRRGRQGGDGHVVFVFDGQQLGRSSSTRTSARGHLWRYVDALDNGDAWPSTRTSAGALTTAGLDGRSPPRARRRRAASIGRLRCDGARVTAPSASSRTWLSNPRPPRRRTAIFLRQTGA